MVGHRRYDLRIVRWIDGYRIETEAIGLRGTEVLARKYEEECLPGELVVFERTLHDYQRHAKKFDA